MRAAQEAGIRLGSIQVVDATHSVAGVAMAKERARGREDKAASGPGRPVGSQGKRRVKERDGGVRVERGYFYGYKQRLSVNAETGLVTAVVHTGGEAPDGKQLAWLVEKDQACGVKAEVYAGDRGYDDGDNHALLEKKGKRSALKLNRYRTQKKDTNKEKWLELEASWEYQLGQRERYKVEQKTGEAKGYHGPGRCRYVGLVRCAIQGYVTALIMNLKRIVRLLTGQRWVVGIPSLGIAQVQGFSV